MLDTVTGLFGLSTDDTEVVHECRRCGRTVDVDSTDDGDCPDCGPDGDVVRYDLR